MAEEWDVVQERAEGTLSVCLSGERRAKSGQDGWDQMTKDLGHKGGVWTLSSCN